MANGGGEQIGLDGVAADKNVRLAHGLEVLVYIGKIQVVLEHVEARPVNRLTDGGDNEVAGNIVLRVLLRYHLLVDPVDFDHAQGSGHAVLILDDSDRGDTGLDLDALLDHGVHLVLGGGHFLDMTTVGDDHLGALAPVLRALLAAAAVAFAGGDDYPGLVTRLGIGVVTAETAGNGRNVHRRVAAADNDDALAGMVELAFVESAQEGDAVGAVGRIGAGDVQLVAGLGADADEHGVEVALDIGEADVLADARVEPHFHAHVEDALHFGIDDLARRAVGGQAEGQHTSKFVAGFEDDAAMAAAAQLVSGRHAGHAAANDGDALAGLDFGLRECETIFNGVVAEELLDRVDADVFLDLDPVATALAGRRADAAHDRGKRVGFGEAAPGILLPRHGRLAVGADWRLLDAAHDIEIAADVLAGRALALAGRCRLDVGRALVGVAGLENVLVPGHMLAVAILVAAEIDLLRDFDCR